jgi:hypothetical protein
MEWLRVACGQRELSTRLGKGLPLVRGFEGRKADLEGGKGNAMGKQNISKESEQ